jgi:hypothetical protein
MDPRQAPTQQRNLRHKVSQKEITDYIYTEYGQLYLDKLRTAELDASADEIFTRAFGLLESLSTTLKIVAVDSLMVKVVPIGK